MTEPRADQLSTHDSDEQLWETSVYRKSSYSSQDGGNCVEIARTPRAVRVRDSKDASLAPFQVSGTAWSAFLPFVTR
ncbi:DUF397 domain-containing protein [Streptomyces sp. NPDC002690]